MGKILSQFYTEYYKINELTKEGEWVGEVFYYYGDLSKADFKNDWRFKAVDGKRKEALFLKLVNQDDMDWKFKI